MDLIAQVTVSGILLGGVFALIAAGLNIIFGVVRIINFAHGELVMLAMYATFFLHNLFGVDPYLSILIVAPALFLVGVIVQRLVIQPILDASAISKIFATVGLSLVLINLALILFGGNFRTVRTSYSDATINLGNVNISVSRLIAFAVALVLFAGLFYVLRYTFLGKAFQAVAEDRSTAQLMGIRVQRLYLLAFGLGSALAGVAGALLMPFSTVYPTVGITYTLVAFVVVVLGGLGNMTGTLLAGLLIGLTETFSATFISPSLSGATYFVIFVLVLLVRPSGLFGKGKGTEEVGLK
ncbi:MAG: branched-chain amino acid ABC transporter permease [Rubrobacter sp.]